MRKKEMIKRWIYGIVGSLVFNGVCILLMKPAKALAAKTVKA